MKENDVIVKLFMRKKITLVLTISCFLFLAWALIGLSSLCQAKPNTMDIQLEADYILACQYLNEGHAGHGAINNIYGNPTWVVPRENAMAILGLIEAADFLVDEAYLDRANLAMDYLNSVQDVTDGAWFDQYDAFNNTIVLTSKSPTQTAEVMIAMYRLGYNHDRYQAMKKGAEYLLLCQTNGFGGLVCGGKEAGGTFSTWNWTSDNSYAYLALKAAEGWALVEGDTVFAQTCQDATADILNGINTYLYNAPVWHQVVDGSGNPVSRPNDWINYAPQMLDLPAVGVGAAAVGDWIHNAFQLPNGGCIGPDTNKQYPGLSFQAALCWFDLVQITYAVDAINWAETSTLWQTIIDGNGIKGGWIDWITVSHPKQKADWWLRFIDTSFYSIAAWLEGYDFGFVDNAPPELSFIGNKVVTAGQELIFEVSASDPDVDDVLKYSAQNLPQGASFNPDTHIFSWKPTLLQTGGYSNVRFQVSDGFLLDYEDIDIIVVRPLRRDIRFKME